MPPISLLIKPSSSNCNLRCQYCFYHSLAEKRTTASYGMMDLQTLELLVKKTFEYADTYCTFAFQGGEPTLAGLDYYKKLIEYVHKYNKNKVKVNYALQTNGMVIDDAWAKFLSDNKFLVGISLDGPKDLHDITRLDPQGKGTFSRVMNAVDLLNRHNAEYNILCVVNNYVARHARMVYSFFKKHNFRYLQFIPCLDPLGEKPGMYPYSLTPGRYAQFLKNLFDEWYNDVSNGNRISIRYFDNLVGMLMGYPPESCDMTGVCGSYFVIEANGGVYPCDFYVTDDWYLGSITDSSFEQLRTSSAANTFIDVSKHADQQCIDCKWFRLCRGGCRRLREPFENGKPVLNYYCSSYREFFEYSAGRMLKLAQYFSRSIR
ncbi:MAG: anaerobic sulfatase maturase [Clostridiaceae bacterium]|nr:anaerobic sulfatase maturase [Clostridiaceae bacterium]